MDDPLCVRVLDRLADLREELEALADRDLIRVAEVGDRLALHVLHREVEPALRGEAAVHDLRDVQVVHHRKRLALLLEARDHLLRVEPEVDDLQRHALDEGLPPLGEPDLAESAFAKKGDELVGADLVA